MGLNYYEFINNTYIMQDKAIPPQKKERAVIELPDNEIYLPLADKSPETAHLLEVYNLSYYRRKSRTELSIPHVEAEIDRLIFDSKKTI